MARHVKCPQCGKLNEKDNAIKEGNRYYCPSCLEEKKEKAEKKKDDWDKLFNYIWELYGEKPTGRMFKQLKEFRDSPYNYTNMGMLLTLKYFYETLNKPVVKGTGVGIIPYVYEEAKKNYIRQMEINKFNSEVTYNKTKKYIKVHPTRSIIKKNLIDLDKLEVENE